MVSVNPRASSHAQEYAQNTTQTMTSCLSKAP